MYKYNHISNDDKLIEALRSQTDKTFKRTYTENLCLYKEELLIRAISSASIGKVDFLIGQVKNVNKLDAFMESVHRGDVDIIRLLHSRGFSFDDTIWDLENMLFNPNEIAVVNGSLETLECLHSIGYALTSSLMNFACMSKDVPILEYLIQQKCPHDEVTCYLEATGNYLMRDDFCIRKEFMTKDSYGCCRLLHNAGFEGVWECDKNTCPFCLENKIELSWELWILESETYSSYIQWLPREMLEDITIELQKD